MRRIAHLSDVHMLHRDPRRSSARYRLATRMVGVGRSLDPAPRARNLARALAAARAAGADHVVVSGDLTELGDDAEFEHLAEVLHDAGLPGDSVTLVPGNHDAYTDPTSWRRALAGPLRAFAAASAGDPAKVVERGDLALFPIDSSRFQSIARSGGEFSVEAARAIERRLRDPALRHQSIVVVLHHPPFAQSRAPLWQWIDGLRGRAHIVDLLRRHPRLQVLHGHLHRVVDRIVALGRDARARGAAATARIFGAPAIVEDDRSARVRLYDVRDGALQVAGLFAM